MEYDVKDKIEWTVIFLTEFGKYHGLTLKQSFNYLLRYKGMNFVEKHYDYLHTQSFLSVVVRSGPSLSLPTAIILPPNPFMRTIL